MKERGRTDSGLLDVCARTVHHFPEKERRSLAFVSGKHHDMKVLRIRVYRTGKWQRGRTTKY